jgi:hypothetical protein
MEKGQQGPDLEHGDTTLFPDFDAYLEAKKPANPNDLRDAAAKNITQAIPEDPYAGHELREARKRVVGGEKSVFGRDPGDADVAAEEVKKMSPDMPDVA